MCVNDEVFESFKYAGTLNSAEAAVYVAACLGQLAWVDVDPLKAASGMAALTGACYRVVDLADLTAVREIVEALDGRTVKELLVLFGGAIADKNIEAVTAVAYRLALGLQGEALAQELAAQCN